MWDAKWKTSAIMEVEFAIETALPYLDTAAPFGSLNPRRAIVLDIDVDYFSQPIMRSLQVMGGSLVVDDEIAEADRSRTSAFVSSRCVSVKPRLCSAK